MSIGSAFPERMNSFALSLRSTVASLPSIGALAKTTCAVGMDFTLAGNRLPERMNRLTTATATMGAQRTYVTRGFATIAAIVTRVIDVLVVFSHARCVPRRTKNEKLKRDTGIIAAIRMHRELWTMTILGKSYTPDKLAAVFEEHLRALARVSELTTERAIAIAEERRLEARIARLARAVKSRLAAYFGADAPEMGEFGFRPDKAPIMSAETKRRANERRQATRKERGVMGRRQRKARAG